MAKGPIPSRETSGISLQGHNRLPAGRPLVIRVMRASLSIQTIIGILLLIGVFVAGVWAGTSGQYREVVGAVTASLPEDSRLEGLLLAPDVSDQPALAESVDQLAEQITVMHSGINSLQTVIDRQNQQILAMSVNLSSTNGACGSAAEMSKGAWTTSHTAFERYERLETTFFGALQTCMAALDAAERVPNPDEIDPQAAEQLGSPAAAETE